MKRFISEYHTKMWIDGHCFEIKRIRKGSKFTIGAGTNNKVESVISETVVNCEDEAEFSYDNVVKYQIDTDEDGKFVTKFRLPFQYYWKLQKSPHFDLKALENSTKTNVFIPNAQDQHLMIVGDSRANIIEARHELHSIISKIRDQSSALQFISIPTTSDEIVENFVKFKEAILNGDPINGMEESIFISPKKLHLTIAVFTLLDDNEKQEAIRALNDYKTTVLEPLIRDNGPIRINVTGLGCMNNNLKRVDVLYANAKIQDETDEMNLQKIANDISNHFYHKGLICRYQDNVKLHMTVINTKYRKVPDSPRKKRWNKKQSIDATTILEKFKDYHFGTCQLNSIHLSLMSTVGEDGFYKPLSVIHF